MVSVWEDVTIPANAHTQSAGSSALASEGYEKWTRKFLAYAPAMLSIES